MLRIIIPLTRCWPFVVITLIAGCWAYFLLRNVGNLDYPLSGEFLTSPFHSEIFQRSLSFWDEHFGLGFSNLLSSPGGAPYAAGAYSGAIEVSNDLINTVFQFSGENLFLNHFACLFLLALSVYLVLMEFRFHSRNVVVAVVLSLAITAIIHSSGLFIVNQQSGGRFVAGQGLMLIAFLQIRRLSRPEFYSSFSIEKLIPLALSLSTLLLILHQYFLVLMMLVGMQGVLDLVGRQDRKNVVVSYAKVFSVFIFLIIVVFGYVMLPVLLSSVSHLMTGEVGRHDSPLGVSLVDLLTIFNHSVHDHFGLLGVWLQFGLAFLGIVFAMFCSGMRRWAIIDLLLFFIFVFLAKGSSPPFENINHWLHVNIPFLRVMGSSYPYLGAIYTLIFYYLIFAISRSLNYLEERFSKAGIYAGVMLVLTLTVVAVCRDNGYLSGDFGGRIQSIEYPEEYYNFKKIAEQDMRLGRAYYFPGEGAQIGWDYKFSPARPMGCCYDLPFSSVFPVNINWSNFIEYSGYYAQTMAFLMHHLRTGDELARILASADTKYAVFDMSLKQNSSAGERMLAIREQVRTSQSFEYKSALSNRYLEVYENKQWQSFASETQSITLGTDDPKIFLEAVRNKVNLSKDSIVISGAITLTDAVELKRNNLLKSVLLYNSDARGLMLDIICSQYALKPDSNFLSSDGHSWYTNNSVYQLQHTKKYGGRFIGRYSLASVSAGAKVAYFDKVLPNTKNRLLIRALVSPDSGMVAVYVNGKKRPLNLHSSEYVGPQWFDLGDVTSLTAKTDIEIESLNAGYTEFIDVVSLVPEKELNESLEIMRSLFVGIHITRVEKPDYLQWKGSQGAENINSFTAQDVGQIKPKRITISHQHFKLHEDFDHFGADSADNLNLAEQEVEVNSPLVRSDEDRNFINKHINNRYLASEDLSSGIYSLKYELIACQPFSKLTLGLHTAYVSEASPLTIYASDDTSTWIKLETRVSDDDGRHILDLSAFAQGKKKIDIKISTTKLKDSPDTIYLNDLMIRGAAGADTMNCELPHFQHSKLDAGLPSSKSDGMGSKYGETGQKSVTVINKAFDSNWQIDGVRPFNINYGFAAFVTTKPSPAPLHDWQYKYPLLICISFGFYIFLWGALIWNSFRRERHSV